MILVSACLAGCPCRYNGEACPNKEVMDLVRAGLALPVCPEQLGGLPTPRGPHEIVRAADGTPHVIDRQGKDSTPAYEEGARKTLALCQALGIEEAILKSKSPSCGSGVVYDGSFSGKLTQGDGLTAALLKENGVRVRSETA